MLYHLITVPPPLSMYSDIYLNYFLFIFYFISSRFTPFSKFIKLVPNES